MTLAQVIALTGPYFAVLLTVIGIPLLVNVLKLLDARAAAIQNLTWRSWATTAVHAVEQVMWAAPSAEKKAAAVRILTGAGVPASLAGPLVESGVHALNAAAAEVLATPPAPVVAVPVVEVPAGPPSVLPH